jgi:hypothetical protein
VFALGQQDEAACEHGFDEAKHDRRSRLAAAMASFFARMSCSTCTIFAWDMPGAWAPAGPRP